MKSLRKEHLRLKVELAKLKLLGAGPRATAKEPQPTPTPPSAENQLVTLMRQEIAALHMLFGMLEVPGAASGETADAIAAKIRAFLYLDEARVSRPMKCADLRIMGLDDTVSEEDVVAAIVRATGCLAEQVRAGTIRPN